MAASISATVTWASIRYSPIARTWLLVAPHMATVCWDADPWVSRRCGGGALRLLPVSQDVCFPKVEHDPVIANITQVGYYQVRSRAEPSFADADGQPDAGGEGRAHPRFRILEDHPPAPAQSLTSGRR